MSSPILCFGQQPCGIFPRRFLAAKIATARRLQSELGGEIVFFLHDSDHDSRETTTILTERHGGREFRLNFQFANSIQKQFSPLYAKRVLPEWKEKTARQLPNYVAPPLVAAFKQTEATTVGEFCLEMYRRMGLLENVRVVRSSDPEIRRRALEVDDYFVDVPYENEIVRARHAGDRLLLHKGAGHHIELPCPPHDAAQISPTRDTRLRWMQSVIGCTHYIAGQGEIQYLNTAETPEVKFVARDDIPESDRAYVECA